MDLVITQAFVLS